MLFEITSPRFACVSFSNQFPDSKHSTRKKQYDSKRKFFNVALIDIRLPYMEGIELLTKFRETTPKMQKIIASGYPTLQNAVDAVDKGADGYIVKPFNVEKVLKTIETQLHKQQEEESEYSQEKVADFIEARVRELDLEKEVSQKHR